MKNKRIKGGLAAFLILMAAAIAMISAIPVFLRGDTADASLLCVASIILFGIGAVIVRGL